MSKSYKEYTSEELDLEPSIQLQITNGDYITATLLTYSAIEYMTQQLLLIGAQQITPETYDKINRIKIQHAALFLYYQKSISVEELKLIDKLIGKRNDYTHDFIKKHLTKKKFSFDSFLKLYRKIFSLYTSKIGKSKTEV